MENSSPSHGYFPAGKFRYPASRRHASALRSSKYSLLTLLFHLRHPNSRKISRVFCEILSPKNSFAKTSSALFRHLPEYLEGRTPKEKYPFLFQKKFHPRQIEKVRSVFLSGLPSEARQWRNDTSVRGSFKLSRTWGVRLVLSFKISSSKC